MDIKFNQNEDHNRRIAAHYRQLEEQVRLGGGKKRIEKHHAKGKLTARERIEALLDKDSPKQEIAALAGQEMYADHGGCPSGGVVVMMGYVSKRLSIIVANDATVKAGAWFPITAKKNLRAQEIAMENHIPIIYLVDSAGIYLPLQHEVFADKDHFGRIFRNNARMSSRGIPQIAAIMGSCVAGGAYLPIMCDESLIVEGTGSVFLAGSYLVKSAIGEQVDNETLGGADTHTKISGVVDYKCENDRACLEKIRSLMDKLGEPDTAGFNRKKPEAPKREVTDIYGLIPSDRVKPYDVRHLLDCLLDGGSFEQYKEEYGSSLLCGYGRIDGWAVGIVANQRLVQKNAKNEMQMGGVIYSDSADKAARFIMNCNQKHIPLIFLQDVTGFMVGSRAEHGGIIKDGAKLVNAMSNSVVPKFTIYMGNSYGAGNYALCGKAYDPRQIYAWPWAKVAVMSAQSAGGTLTQIQMAAAEKQGEELTEKKKKEIKEEVSEWYEKTMDPAYAAARLWIDGIITPEETRQSISLGIAAANHKKADDDFNVGVFQV